MNFSTVSILLVLVCISASAKSARILAIFHGHSPSHYFLGNTLLKELAQKGHKVTMVAPFKEKHPPKNYHQVILSGLLEDVKNIIEFNDLYETTEVNPYMFIPIIAQQFGKISDKVLKHPNIHQLLHSNQTFDVVIIEQFLNDAMKGFAHHFKAPFILFSTLPTNYWINPIVGNPSPPSYASNFFLSYPTKMTFFQRLHNTLINTLSILINTYYTYEQENKVMRKYFPNHPDHLSDIIYNASLVLLNAHPSINSPVPYVPNMIDIGGFHVKPPGKLPPDLQQFLDSASEGVIYFSMGSNLKSTSIAPEKRAAILKVFSKLKEKVLWKWEQDELPDQPSNVKLAKWLPQQDILAHPNVKLFITHGGLLSATETIYHGVPILVVPIYGDQKLNAAAAVNNGYGLSLPYIELTEEKLSIILNELLNNPKYKENAKRRSELLLDRPMKPLDSAVYWVEYVIRHKGASHLRVGALDLAWYQYFLLDVISFIFLVITLSIFISYNFIKFILSKVNVFKTKKLKEY